MKLPEIFIEQRPNSVFPSNVANMMTINKKMYGYNLTLHFIPVFSVLSQVPVRLISGSAAGHRRTHVTIRS